MLLATRITEDDLNVFIYFSIFIRDAWERAELTDQKVDSASHPPCQAGWT